MKSTTGIALNDVQAVYSGPEGDLWELVMGQQIHIGGLKSSMDLAEKAGIKPGMTGVDLCCCNGAGMRFLLRFQNVGFMYGVDATQCVLDRGCSKCEVEGYSDKVKFILSDVCDTGLPANSVDFVWGEDAWCYVADKPALIAETVRVVKPGGVIAFTDWVEGPAGMSEPEAERFMKFMKFPNVQDISGYAGLLEANGCEVVRAEDTGRFGPYVDLYLGMLDMQLTSDALRIIGYDMDLFQAMAGEMMFMQQLAHAGKIAQGLFVARKK